MSALLHLAGYYDFTGEDHPEYERTNVEGTRRMLAFARALGCERFVFASSIAACDFSRPGETLSECSPADGDHPYAVSKRRGEEAVRAEANLPTAIVRFAAIYSDWCEYAPLYSFLETWLSRRWNARVLGGRGRSAVPYLHVRDACTMLDRVLEMRLDLEPAEVLLASPNGSTTHLAAFRAATHYASGRPVRPLRIPKPLSRLGLIGLDVAGRLRARRPFERPWMGRLIDERLHVDARHTHARLGWEPRPRLDLLRRLPFLIENRKSQRGAWEARNELALHAPDLPVQVRVLRLFEEREEDLLNAYSAAMLGAGERFPHYARMTEADRLWNHRQLLGNLSLAIRTRHRALFRRYCLDLARHRAQQGIPQGELRAAIQSLERVCRELLEADPHAQGLGRALHDLIEQAIEFGLDGVEDAYEEATSGAAPSLAVEESEA